MADVGKGFDRLAAVYDGMARLVYGKSIRRVQTHYLSQWPKDARILIVGGGTGWFLEEVLKQTDPEYVLYVDLSSQMIEKSRKRIAKCSQPLAERVEFFCGKIHDIPGQRDLFDVVVTHFYLDMFNGEELKQQIAALQGLLRPGGLWSLADFAYVKKGLMRPVSRFLVGTMYLFFRMVAGIGSRRLEDYPALLEDSGLEQRDGVAFYGGMIRGAVFLNR